MVPAPVPRFSTALDIILKLAWQGADQKDGSTRQLCIPRGGGYSEFTGTPHARRKIYGVQTGGKLHTLQHPVWHAGRTGGLSWWGGVISQGLVVKIRPFLRL